MILKKYMQLYSIPHPPLTARIINFNAPCMLEQACWWRARTAYKLKKIQIGS
jgi:hypothetical protein